MNESGSTASEWRSAWTLVLAGAVGFSFFSVLLASTGLFMQPLGREFGWSRTILSSGPSIATATTAIMSPFIGALIDRFGSRRIVLPGVVATTAATVAFGWLTGSSVQWIALWVVFGLIGVSIKSTAWTAAVLGVFSKGRGLALGLTLSGAAIAQIGVPPLTYWLIDSFGWRLAFIWLGLGWGGVTFLLCSLFFFDARDIIARRKLAAGDATPSPSSVDLPGLTRAQALRDSALWRVAISNFVVMALTIGLAIHLVPILTEAGVSREKAAWLSSLTGAAGIAGKLITGALLDRFKPNWIGGVTLGVAALSFFLLMDGIRSPAAIICAMLVNGYAAGTKTQITGFLTASYGGMRNFGAIYGTMAALMALASGLGPLLAGIIYDRAGGYGPFLAAGTVGCALGGILMISLPAYPKFMKTVALEPAAR